MYLKKVQKGAVAPPKRAVKFGWWGREGLPGLGNPVDEAVKPGVVGRSGRGTLTVLPFFLIPDRVKRALDKPLITIPVPENETAAFLDHFTGIINLIFFYHYRLYCTGTGNKKTRW